MSQGTKAMDPIPNSDPNANTAPSLFSPASLLWAHQLRREHNTLVSRLDALEEALASSSAKAITTTEDLKSDLETRVKEVGDILGVAQGEVDMIKAGIEELMGWKEVFEQSQRDAVGKWERKEEEWRREGEKREEARQLVEGGLREILDGVRGLKRVVEEMRREREQEKEKEKERDKEKEMKTLPYKATYLNLEHSDDDDNEPFRSPSLPPILHAPHSQQRQRHNVPSTISGTPTMTHLPSSTPTRSSLPPQAPPDGYSAILVPDSMPPAPPSPHPDQTAAADCEFQTSPPRFPHSPIAQPSGNFEYANIEKAKEDEVQAPQQGPGETLESYMERCWVVLSRCPQGEERRVISTFWGGMEDGNAKGGLGEELERRGWKWEVVRQFVDSLSEGLGEEGKGKMEEGGLAETGKRDRCLVRGEGNVATGRNGAVEKKRRKAKVKKRRAIPVIWPVDEEGEGWLVVQNGLT
ncbi:predicted protein [Histoplasma mississippiense (nom. inval.)]|uniref:predicted protein n=1 Tax=Ajellomyces capsulatus (strain NAm1 / WU24) TaxID=2059318 RepID=UPI000157C111|nr:predicted protein [Histoplasma mississippiense (nom. inval.)]EDN07762.1 predicted protein [Histoplasma mississippiense (nom. inval.)]